MRAETSTIRLARDAAGGESSTRSGSIGASQESKTQVRPDGVLQDRISGLVDSQQITYTYDPTGRRIAKDVDGEVTKYVAACPFGELRASSEPAEWDADDTLLRKFIHDLSIDGMNSADTLECWSVKKRTMRGPIPGGRWAATPSSASSILCSAAASVPCPSAARETPKPPDPKPVQRRTYR